MFTLPGLYLEINSFTYILLIAIHQFNLLVFNGQNKYHGSLSEK